MQTFSSKLRKNENFPMRTNICILILFFLFRSLFESSQSLFWASFGMVGLETFELEGIKSYTRFWGLLMFGSYSVINVIVLLNLLIAMMSNSYAMIDVSFFFFSCFISIFIHSFRFFFVLLYFYFIHYLYGFCSFNSIV